jgi:hypothetical protein
MQWKYDIHVRNTIAPICARSSAPCCGEGIPVPVHSKSFNDHGIKDSPRASQRERERERERERVARNEKRPCPDTQARPLIFIHGNCA